MNNNSLEYQIEKLNQKNKIIYKIIYLLILFVLSLIIIFFSEFLLNNFNPNILPSDISFFIVLITLYYIDYKFAFIISILNSIMIILIYGNWDFGIAYFQSAILFISSWWILNNKHFKKYNNKNTPRFILVLVYIFMAIIFTIITLLITQFIAWPILFNSFKIDKWEKLQLISFFDYIFIYIINILLFFVALRLIPKIKILAKKIEQPLIKTINRIIAFLK